MNSTPLPRYHYEFFRDTAVGDTQQETRYLQRSQWLVFDRNSVGCMCSLGTEREAARIVAALNRFAKTAAAHAYEEMPWREAQRAKQKASA